VGAGEVGAGEVGTGEVGAGVDDFSFLQTNFLPFLIQVNFFAEEMAFMPNFEHEAPSTGATA
jgi:hypothetical protein